MGGWRGWKNRSRKSKQAGQQWKQLTIFYQQKGRGLLDSTRDKNLAIINSCLVLREGRNNHLRSCSKESVWHLYFKSTALNVQTRLAWIPFKQYNQRSPICCIHEKSGENVEAGQSQPANILMDCAFSYWSRLEQLSYRTSICHFLRFNIRKWCFILKCRGPACMCPAGLMKWPW